MIIHLELIFDRLEEKKFPNLKLVTRPIISFSHVKSITGSYLAEKPRRISLTSASSIFFRFHIKGRKV